MVMGMGWDFMLLVLSSYSLGMVRKVACVIDGYLDYSGARDRQAQQGPSSVSRAAGNNCRQHCLNGFMVVG